MTSSPKRVIVLGGGFAGVSFAQELAKLLRRGDRRGEPPAPGPGTTPLGRRDVDVVLVNRDNYFVFQPLLADVISGSIETTHVVVPLRRMLPRTRVVVGEIESIDPVRKVVQVRRRGGGQPVPLEYDALVLALGGVTDFRAVPGMAEHSLGVRTLGDAFYLRNRALDMLEEAAIETDPDRRRRLLTFVVVGGGSTGVEVAAELHDLLHLAAPSFKSTADLAPRVVLIHSRTRVLSEFGERLARRATRRLRAVGVELSLGRRLARVEPHAVVLDDGTTIEAETVVSTVGNAPNPILRHLPTGHDPKGWLLPDATFAVPGLDGVWALGDCASIADPATGRPMPATAQHAIREGPAAARNVLRALEGRPAEPFHYGQLGMLVSLGRRHGIGEVLGIPVSGLIGWFMWRSYYLARLPTIERRIRVAIDWTLDWFLARDIVEINVRRTVARPGEIAGELGGEPVSAGTRDEVHDELVV
jgi:NADH:ubiquinone reductase (H+-translocating)